MQNPHAVYPMHSRVWILFLCLFLNILTSGMKKLTSAK